MIESEESKKRLQDFLERNIQETVIPLPAKRIKQDKRPPIFMEVGGNRIGVEVHTIVQKMIFGFPTEDPLFPEDRRSLIVGIPTDMREEKYITSRVKFLLPSTRLNDKNYVFLENQGSIEKLPRGLYHMEISEYKVESPAYVIRDEKKVREYLQQVFEKQEIRSSGELPPEEMRRLFYLKKLPSSVEEVIETYSSSLNWGEREKRIRI